jgi:hypothetical protein
MSALREEQVDAGHRQCGKGRSHPVHPARGRTTCIVGGHRLGAEHDRGHTEHQDQDEDRAIPETVDHESADQCVDPTHPAVDRRDDATAEAEGLAAQSFPQNQESQTERDVAATLKHPAQQHDRQRGAHDAQTPSQCTARS